MLTQNLLVAACILMTVMILSGAALMAWQGWLALKARELDRRLHPAEIETVPREGAARIELADLKERVRKLEAIANGVDL